MSRLVYTCLHRPATDGLDTVVAREDDRVPLAAFRDPADASAWCDAMNSKSWKIDQRVDVEVVKSPK